ncbi:hypothetical protein [Novipirellula aureliae]|uniref:hypothetical protein n=1 Tax=Novipirellula aureliae TaxID=2527966 RepID=UPI0018CF4739|nr:hypothetical protein [Novipirellula aureliae]
MIDDFQADDSFVRTTDDLFADAVAQQTNGECVTSDGIGIESVTIDFCRSIKLHFRLLFLDAPDGFWEAPGQFSVVPDPTNTDLQLATLSCGVREPDGDFWYPSSNRRRSVVLPDDYDWAYSRTRVYGSQTISAWMKTRRRSGEP